MSDMNWDHDDFENAMLFDAMSEDATSNYQPGSSPCMLAIVIYVIVGFVLEGFVLCVLGVDIINMPAIITLMLWGFFSWIAGLVLKEFGWY